MLGRLIDWIRDRRAKPALRQTLESMVKTGNLKPSDENAVRYALSHPHLLRRLHQRMNREAAQDPDVKDKGFDVMETSATRQRPILTWLWNHRQQILEALWEAIRVAGIVLPLLGVSRPDKSGPQPVK